MFTDTAAEPTTIIRFARPEFYSEQPIYSAQPNLRRSTAVTFTEANPSRIEKRRQRTRTFAEDPFRSRFGRRLPKAMREEARGLDWKSFINTYAPADIRVESWYSSRQSSGRFGYEIGMTGLRSDGIGTQVSITAMGVASAMSEVLADHGYAVEIAEFHQYDIFEATVTFIYTVHKRKRVWAVGFGSNRDLSIASALCSAATRLHLR
ncbi:hypothetical protein [Corynebacterium heidelbergense]|uniref:Acetyl-CoA acetyltransferase n=1 Tax=Corynebacterium heidelbergense TaxID=2055947 RepID=A0A364VC35_9CORY|nr:hypothetical protein [Corynebacterium heidelbergense]RAV34180.1 hypothetical protein CWC39_04550 [Corynebacterium heidelbergense]WCZ35859.1 hypothetical protein CHEID_01405 [Corynebacterium heidelbergense]